jgi:heme A synthase
MIAVGGMTRLTDSGLSITEWRPVTGALPPMSDADWQAEFDKYRADPAVPAGQPRHERWPNSRSSTGGNGATGSWAA